MQTRNQGPGNSKRAKGEKAAPDPGRVMGRPPLPRKVARSRRVVTFVTEREKACLERLAGAASQSVSAVCHRLIAEGLERDRRTKPNKNNEGARQ